MRPIRYSDFGADVTGRTCALSAIAAAHDYANAHGLPVRADDGATYLLASTDATATVRTDTDWGSARFILDDTALALSHRGHNFFDIAPDAPPIPLDAAALTPPTRTSTALGMPLPVRCIVNFTDDGVRQFIRRGLNRDNGGPMVDAVITERDGSFDPDSRPIWDFAALTDVTAYPIEDKPITVGGGTFVTRANALPSAYTYVARGIAVGRSNLTLTGITHLIEDEGDHGAPYIGFLLLRRAANICIRDCTFTGHMTYRTIGAAGKPVSMGTYEISGGGVIGLRFEHCRQTNAITDTRCWGGLGTNACKNIVYEDCVLSRFDAHRGVANVTIRRSTLGHQGINAIGSGSILLEDSHVIARALVNFRPDYGSTWDGTLTVRNCTFTPTTREPAAILRGANDGKHNFGYPCTLPHEIDIDGLTVETEGEAVLFGEFDADFDPSADTPYPYRLPDTVRLRSAATLTGAPLGVAENPTMFAAVHIDRS